MGIGDKKGFTLMELLTVMAIFITLLGIAGVAIARYQQRTRLRTTTEAIAADIREARWKARLSGDVCTVVFFPDGRNYAVNGVLSMELPAGIRFGFDPSVTGKPSQPYEMPPDDGISFDSGRKNIARFYPTGTVSPTGSVFLTNGKDTFAITRSSAGVAFDRLPDADGWAPQVGFAAGFPAARDPEEKKAWLAHCYGAVGVARGNDPASGSGTDLYAVIGHAPRHLDRNITVVGRVVQGMELPSTLPRGPAPMGFYESAAQRTAIRKLRLMADVPAAERTALQVIRTDTATFTELVESRRNRVDDWNKVPAGYIERCNVHLPVRRP